MSHGHEWIAHIKNVRAFYSKRDDEQMHDRYWITGDVERCRHCPELRIRPHNPGLSIVNVEAA